MGQFFLSRSFLPPEVDRSSSEDWSSSAILSAVIAPGRVQVLSWNEPESTKKEKKNKQKFFWKIMWKWKQKRKQKEEKEEEKEGEKEEEKGEGEGE